MTRELVLGVDFGSTSTVAGALVNDRIALVQDRGDCIIPSVVYVPDRGPIEVGRSAVAHQLTEPAKVIRSIKRVIGLPCTAPLVRHYAATAPYRVDCSRERPILKLHSGELAPEQVFASILRHVSDLAEARLGAPVTKVVLTMAAVAPPGYRDAAMRAAKIARLELVDLIAEPIAGVLALDLHQETTQRRIVVCDFGGGTFDVAAVVQDGQRFTPVATHGDQYLGGDDLDDALADAIAGQLYRRTRFDLHRDVVRWNELRLRCESAKRSLSAVAETPFAMRDAYVHEGQSKDLRFTLAASFVESVWAPLLERARGVVAELLQLAGWSPSTVDVVGLIGGSSRVPAFRAAMAAGFGRGKLQFADNAEVAVAQGATLLTARHCGQTMARELVAS